MNLQAAQKELHSKSPRVAPHALALETVIVLSFSVFLVGIFG